MGGIYIHVPFCRKACHYCDFHFSTQLKGKSAMVDSIRAEMDIRSEEVPA
ncbi:MAG: oxygen-independent coproporphyrinogen-3 oxidase, partial [Sphingobacteriales bacterium]